MLYISRVEVDNIRDFFLSNDVNLLSGAHAN